MSSVGRYGEVFHSTNQILMPGANILRSLIHKIVGTKKSIKFTNGI
jgi:hypothetical protein